MCVVLIKLSKSSYANPPVTFYDSNNLKICFEKKLSTLNHIEVLILHLFFPVQSLKSTQRISVVAEIEALNKIEIAEKQALKEAEVLNVFKEVDAANVIKALNET